MNRGIVALLKFIEHSHKQSGISDDTYYEVKGEALKKLAHVKKFGRLDDYKRILDKYEEEGYDWDGEYDAMGPEEVVENFVERVDRPRATRKDQIARIAKERASLVEAKRNVEAMLEVLEEGFNEGSITQATYLELRKENGRKLDRITQLINETQFTDARAGDLGGSRHASDDERAYGGGEDYRTPGRATRGVDSPRPRSTARDEGRDYDEAPRRGARYADEEARPAGGRLRNYELPSNRTYTDETDFSTGEYADSAEGEGGDEAQGQSNGPWVEGYHDDESAYGKQYTPPSPRAPVIDDSSMREARDIISRLRLSPGADDTSYSQASGGGPVSSRDTAYATAGSARGFSAEAMPLTPAEKAAMGDEKDKPKMPTPIADTAPAAASNPDDIIGRLRGAISQAAETVTHHAPQQQAQQQSAQPTSGFSQATGTEAASTATGGASSAKLEIELEKLKTRVDALGEMREGLYERVSTIMENVGEIRSMVFSVDGAIKKQEATTEQFTDLVKSIEPQKYMKELEKRDGESEQMALRVEKLEGMVQDLAHGVSAVRSLLESIGSLRNISEVNKDVAVKTGRMESMLGKAERLNEDLSTEFVELNRRLQDFGTYRGRQDLLAESVKELVTMVESLNAKLGEFSTKEDSKTASHEIEDLKQSLKEFNAKIILAQQGRDLPEPVKELRKKINSVKLILAETEEEYLDKTISEVDYKKIRETNFRKMRELEQEISRRLAEVTQTEDRDTLKATSIGQSTARVVQEEAPRDEETQEPQAEPMTIGKPASAASVVAKVRAAVRSKAPVPVVEQEEEHAPMPEADAPQTPAAAVVAQAQVPIEKSPMTDDEEKKAVAVVTQRLKVAQENVEAAHPAPAAKVTSAFSSMVNRVSTAISKARPKAVTATAPKKEEAEAPQVQPVVEGVPDETPAKPAPGAIGVQTPMEKAAAAAQVPAAAEQPVPQAPSRRRMYMGTKTAPAEPTVSEPEIDLASIPQPELDAHTHNLKNSGVADIISGIMDELTPAERKAREAAARKAARQEKVKEAQDAKAEAKTKAAPAAEQAQVNPKEEVDVTVLLDRLRADLKKLKTSAATVKEELEEQAGREKTPAKIAVQKPKTPAATRTKSRPWPKAAAAKARVPTAAPKAAPAKKITPPKQAVLTPTPAKATPNAQKPAAAKGKPTPAKAAPKRRK
jgi:hypothetical protein